MRTYSLLLCTLFLLSTGVHAQSTKTPVYHPFTGTMVLSIEAGPTSSYTDYSYDALSLDYTGRASIEYFFPFYSKSVFGLRAFSGTGFIKGKDKALTPKNFRTDILYAGGGLIYGLSLGESVFPYIFAGGSYLWFNPKDDNGAIPLPTGVKKNEVDINGELGFRIALTENLTFNIAGTVHVSPRDYLDALKAGTNNDVFFSALAGFSIAFFASGDADNDGVENSKDNCPDTPLGVRVDEHGCPVDSDHDGVPDYIDKCSNTPDQVKVDENGCPIDSDHDGVPDYLDICPGTLAGINVDEFGCPKDSDGDGVPDYLDSCPNTPKNVAVDKNGCPLDSDGDKVPDYLDKCPNTPAGVQVDANGCPLAKEQVIREVPVIKEVPVEKEIVLSAGASFKPGSSVLLPTASEDLDQLVKIMKDNLNTTWLIEGHTDNKGTHEQNKKLSLARAQAVQKYFVVKGLRKDRFTVRGLGPDFPIADNNSEEGRLRNRRVVIIRVK